MSAYTWTWEAHGLRINTSRFQHERGGLSVECVLERQREDEWVRFSSHRLSLTSLSQRREFVRDMTEAWQGPDWKVIARQLCDKSIAAYRASEPSQLSTGETPLEEGNWLLNPFVYDGHSTVIYGPGSSGKSMLGVLSALLFVQGGCVAGLAAAGGLTPLYLDWERAFSTFDSRIGALVKGHPDLQPAARQVCYQRVSRPLPECVEDITETIERRKADVLILDSLGMAAGGDLNAPDAATRLFEAIDTIGLPTLIIGHTHKAGEDKTIYGSVFFYNLPTVIWEVTVDREEELGPLRLGLTNRKDNLAPYHAPMGISLTFQTATCCAEAFNPAESPVLAPKISRSRRIRHLLDDHQKRTVAQIAEALNDDEHAVRTELNKRYNKGKYWQKTGEEWERL